MRRKILPLLLSALLAASPSYLAATGQDMEDVIQELNDLHRPNACTEDSGFTAISASMMGWGIGLAIGIALLAGLLPSSD
jgi:hypothetical protein